jgi:hypothetical protein
MDRSGAPVSSGLSEVRAAANSLFDGGRVGRLDEALGALDAIKGAFFETSHRGSPTIGYSTTGSFGQWLPWDFIQVASTPY